MKLRELLTEQATPGDWIDNIVAKVKNHGPSIQAKNNQWMHDWGKPYIWLMKFFDVTMAITQLYLELDVYDKLYTSKRISRSDLEERRENAFGIFTAQILLPAVIRKIASSNAVLYVARIILWILGLLGSTVSLGASIAAVIGTEAFLMWFTHFLNTKEGQDWLAGTFLMSIIKNMGKVEDYVWSELTGYYDNKGPKTTEPDIGQPSDSNTPTTPATDPQKTGSAEYDKSKDNTDPLTAPTGFVKSEPIHSLKIN